MPSWLISLDTNFSEPRGSEELTRTCAGIAPHRAYEEIDSSKRELELRIVERQQVEQERVAHLRYLEHMGRLDGVIRRASDLCELMTEGLRTVFEIFECDRAWLLHPCTIDVAEWQIRAEHTSTEFPGFLARGGSVSRADIEAEDIEAIAAALECDGPLVFDPGSRRPATALLREMGVQAQMLIAIRPAMDSPWLLGIHHCRPDGDGQQVGSPGGHKP